MAATTKSTREEELTCSIARALEVVGDRWTLLILREAALHDVTRFADFRDRLGIAPDILTNRLGILVDGGVMERKPYREPGARTRYSYHLTPAGEKVRLVLAALQQWGDETRPPASGPSALRRSADEDRPVRVAFVDDIDTVIPPSDVLFTPAGGSSPEATIRAGARDLAARHGPCRRPRLAHMINRTGAYQIHGSGSLSAVTVTSIDRSREHSPVVGRRLGHSPPPPAAGVLDLAVFLGRALDDVRDRTGLGDQTQVAGVDPGDLGVGPRCHELMRSSVMRCRGAEDVVRRDQFSTPAFRGTVRRSPWRRGSARRPARRPAGRVSVGELGSE